MEEEKKWKRAQVQYTAKRSSRTFHFTYSFDINTPHIMYYVIYIKLVDRMTS